MKRIVRWLGIGFGAITGLGILLAGIVYGVSNYRLHQVHTFIDTPRLTFSTDSITLARGAHIANSYGNCTYCHGDDLGGRLYPYGGPMIVASASNLTRGRGGVSAAFTDEDWIRSIRHGIHKDGTSMILMPSEVFVKLTKGDLSALVSYLKQLPPVDRQLPQSNLLPLGRALLTAGKFKILVAEKTPDLPLTEDISPQDTLAYGRYLADISGCLGCHGKTLAGGERHGPPGTPLTPNLTPAGRVHTWSETQFRHVLRTGQRPDGTILDTSMPWQTAGQMSDSELHAIWQYLRSVPPLPYGSR
ncbi:c-type cytochrome [Spirosoma sp. KNUC1025]|uniref:c-type cytochrome n=1 Tax=Spirosoma sp. KNUC1025 TaxID=2894082 RepID=UPI001E4F5429|nr:cytochrome c [Spirosoma sp. KNUC1025]UFH57584.1 cytochrome c [Spirosoma sp. KNUC1025]